MQQMQMEMMISIHLIWNSNGELNLKEVMQYVN